jgi:multiple sugar transport system permease protein
MEIERNSGLKQTVTAILLVIFTLFCVFPFFWMILTSIKSRVDVIDPSVWIFKPTLDNYLRIFEKRNLLFNIMNSLIVVGGTTVISLVLGTLAAYGFARFQFKRKEDLAFWILSLRMLPPMAVVISFFVLGRLLHLLDTHIYLIIIYLSFNVPFTIWMMRGFIEDIPLEIEESAWLDGCSRYRGFFSVVFPLISPGLIATAIFCIIQSWNEFSLAFFLTTFNAKTIPTIVTAFLSVTGVLWGEMAAVGIVAIAPIIIFAFLVQKNLVRGMTFGAIKG